VSNAFSCDICGDCVSDEAAAKNLRQLASPNLTIKPPAPLPETTVDTKLVFNVMVPHVCNACWKLVVKELRTFILNNIGQET